MAPKSGNLSHIRSWSVLSAAALVIAVLPVAPLAAQASDSGSTADPGPVRCTVTGTPGDDVLVGGPGNDVLCGLGGDDRLSGRDGDDVLRGGTGDDVLVGGAGQDELQGGRGADVLSAGRGDDDLRGGRGNDVLRGNDPARFRDDLRCGPGHSDRAFADDNDIVARSCEVPEPNRAPTDVALHPATVAENAPAGTEVGTLSVTDPDRKDVHSFRVVPGAGDTDNASFNLAGRRLLTTRSFDFESGGALSLRVRVTDRAGTTYDEVLAVSVTDLDENAAPVAVDDTFSTAEDTTLTLPVGGPRSPAANDRDSDVLTVTAVSGAAGGTVSLTGDTLRFAPTPDRCGPGAGSFDYTVSDGRGGADLGRVSVDVTCVPDDPTATDDTATRSEDDGASDIPVLANDADADGDPLRIADVTQPDHGTVVITGGGTGLSYEPDADYCNDPGDQGADTFTYSLTPGGASATVAVTVVCVDDAPVAVDDDETVDEDADAASIDVLDNDTDSDGGPLRVVSITQPDHGTASFTDAGVTYEPDTNYCNTGAGDEADTFTYELNGGSQGTVSVTVTCVQDAPVAVDDTAGFDEDDAAGTIDVLANDTDVDGGPMTIESVTSPDNGTVVVAGDGSDLTYEPDADYCNAPGAQAPDTFTYELNGGSTGTVSVRVDCVDDLPTAVDDETTIDEDAGATAIAVRANDTDVDGGPKSIESVTQPADGTVAITGGGTGLTYTPDADYCNDPGAAPADTFDYVLNGSSSATVSVTVTCLDDAPSAVADVATVFEDAPATSVDVLDNDTDIDGGPMSVQSVTQPAHGSVAITGSGTGLTYEPDEDYCNDPRAGGPDVFSYTLNGGDSTSVTVTVTCDVPPTAADDAATVEEDSSTTSIDVIDNDSNADGGPKTVVAVTQPANGTATATGSGVTYAPGPDYCNTPPGTDPDTFTYELNGGSIATVRVSVTCVDDDPVAVDDNATVNEDASASALNVLANDTDVDGGETSIASASDPTHGTVVITGDGTGLTYEPDVDYCNTGVAQDDTFTYTLNGGSTATVSVEVTCDDDPPTAVDDAATVVEDAATTSIAVLGNDTDSDGGPIRVDSVTQPVHGDAAVGADSEDVTYTPDVNYCNDPVAGSVDSFDYVLNGGSTGTVSVTVTCVDDVPVAVDDTRTVLSNAAASDIDVLANDTDVDGGPRIIASASDPAHGTVAITGDGAGLTYEPDADYCNDPDPDGLGPDTFTYEVNGGSSATVTVTVTCDTPPTAEDDQATIVEDAAAVRIDVLANETDPDAGPRTVERVAQPANGTAVIIEGGDALTYEPDADYCNAPPGTTPDTFTYTVNGGSSATVSVTVTCVDDTPIAVDDARTVAEDSGALAVPVLSNDTDVDGGPRTIEDVTQGTHGSVAITGGGAGLTYAPQADYCNDGAGDGPDSFTYALNGGSTATVTMTVTCVNDAPVADDETIAGGIGNTTLVSDDPTDPAPTSTSISRTVTGDLLTGDTDIDGPGELVVVAGTFATNDGGSVVVESDGDFTFSPAPGVSCTDSSDFFDYTVSEPGTSALTDTGRVTITISDCVWYVSNNATGNAGTSSAPFDTLAQVQAPSAAGHTIFVFDGNNTSSGYAASLTLKADQRLLGEAADLAVAGVLLRAGAPAARPLIAGLNGDAVNLASGNTVRGLDIDPQGVGGGIAGGATAVGGTIHDVRITDASPFGTQPGLELDGTSGTWNINGLQVDNSGASGVRLNNAGTVNFATGVGPNTVRTVGAKALDLSGTALGTSSVIADITVTGSATGGVSLTSTTGTISLGDGVGNDLSLTGITGATAALSLTNAGNVTVPGSGTSNVSINGGPAVQVTGAPGATVRLDLDDVDSAGSTTRGISLAALQDGTFSAGSGSSITDAAVTSFELVGGSGAVTYDGTITSDTGRLVQVQNTTGGVKDFNGAITDNNDGDGGETGILLSSNTGATIRFDGGTTVRTTGNRAFTATGGGTVAVTGTNTLQTTTGTPLTFTDTTIHDADLTFRSIASAGAVNGIVLSSTVNAAGRLVVEGSGGTCTIADPTCTGGAILGSTGAGISLTNVPGGASLTTMRVANGLDDGIRATTVNDVDLANLVVTSNGNFHGGGAEERGLDYLNVTGTPQIVGTVVSGSDDSNAHIQNTSGSSTLTVAGSTFSDSKFNAGLRLRGEGTSTVTASVTGSFFSLNADPGFSMQTDSANSAQQVLVFNDNEVSGGSSNAVSARPQVSINTGGGSVVKARVSNNRIKSGAGSELILNTLASHTGTFDATVTGNLINDAQPGALDALTDGGSSIFGWAHGDGLTRMTISNNVVADSGGRALELGHNDGSGDADFTLVGNTFGRPDASVNSFEGIYVYAGDDDLTETSDVCVDFRVGNDMDGFDDAGIGNSSSPDIAFDRYQDASLRFAGYNATTTPGLQAFLRSRNAPSPNLTVMAYALESTATAEAACDVAQGTP